MNKTLKSVRLFASVGILTASTLMPVSSVFAEETAATPATVTTTSETHTPPPKPATTQAVHNPYGLEALWREGDIVAKSTLFILVLMSIGTWYIMVTKFIQQAKIKRQGKEVEAKFWDAASIDGAAGTLGEASAYRESRSICKKLRPLLSFSRMPRTGCCEFHSLKRCF